jgi:hypothetical protein
MSEPKICSVGGCYTRISRCDGRRLTRCARCVRLGKKAILEASQ